MPFKSQAQKKWMFANKPEMAKEWANATPDGARLPQRVGEKKAPTRAGKKPTGYRTR